MSLDGYFIEDLSEGMTAVFGKTITDADILMFAGVSGDTNPVHLNEEFAAGTPFQGRIAHGMLTASLISTVLGTKLPGPGCVYLSQSLKFKAPVRAGDTVRAEVTVTAIDRDRRRVTFATVCKVGGKPVLEGEA
ncbi:MAG: MaoC family dehydratase, partial [Geminicoccaceae bacterium]